MCQLNNYRRGLTPLRRGLLGLVRPNYSNRAPGNPWQLTGWLLSMLLLLLAFAPTPGNAGKLLRASLNWKKTAFFAFWILVFVISHLWNFRTAPWNGNALFDESGWDLYFLKHYVIGRPFQAAWFHPPWISRETVFHYFVWFFCRLFGYNILSYEAAQFVVWCAIFLFTLLLVHLLFESWTVTSITALTLNFLPFSFIYTFMGYRCCRSRYRPTGLLLPGVILALRQRRYEIVLLATIPVAAAFVASCCSRTGCFCQSLRIILMGFAFLPG